MRSATNPRRNNDSFVTMLVAVAVASLATINGAPTAKPTIPDMMQSHHKPPAALALARGDSSVFDCVMFCTNAVVAGWAGPGLIVAGILAPQIKSQKMIGNSPSSRIIAI